MSIQNLLLIYTIVIFGVTINTVGMQLRIDYFRKKKSLTVRKLAELAGTTLGQLNNIRLNHHQIKLYWLQRIAAPLGIYPSELLPEDWQKPGEIDSELLQHIIEDILTNCDKLNLDFEPATLGVLIVERYRRAVEHPELSDESSRNMLEGMKFAEKINQKKEEKP